MRALVLTVLLIVAIGSPASAQQKAPQSQANGKTCTYDQCVSVNKARGWDKCCGQSLVQRQPFKCDS
ncbi:hypothetical protein [Bradyrhizobium liaoningense]|uniref:hypothetical protein n=1 Tax=Bradyrhizobium liaoningense TaxID=43992 RepID=UPI001BAD16A0|nr:hypothetical protein [Bradyrhizobium liaoningense]MBR0817927.1 hypothetical protein [Bradyrhizobium liaoningense]